MYMPKQFMNLFDSILSCDAVFAKMSIIYASYQPKCSFLQAQVPLDGYDSPTKKRRFPQRGTVYAMYLDTAARFLFPLFYIIFIIAYWWYYVNA